MLKLTLKNKGELQLGKFNQACLIAIAKASETINRKLDDALDGLLANDKTSILICFWGIIENKKDLGFLSFEEFINYLNDNPIADADFDKVLDILLKKRIESFKLESSKIKKKRLMMIVLALASNFSISAITCFVILISVGLITL